MIGLDYPKKMIGQDFNQFYSFTSNDKRVNKNN